MAHYTAKATNSKNFTLTSDNEKIGELIYTKWYSFNAEIELANGSKYQLKPRGFWDSTIELKDGDKTLLEFKMGWKGIVIKTFFNDKEEGFLLKTKGLLSNKFLLLDTDQQELMACETGFKWSTLNFDQNIETSPVFDNFDNKELLILTVLHCINYFITTVAAVA